MVGAGYWILRLVPARSRRGILISVWGTWLVSGGRPYGPDTLGSLIGWLCWGAAAEEPVGVRGYLEGGLVIAVGRGSHILGVGMVRGLEILVGLLARWLLRFWVLPSGAPFSLPSILAGGWPLLTLRPPVR